MKSMFEFKIRMKIHDRTRFFPDRINSGI